MRNFSLLDSFIVEVDSALRTLIPPTHRLSKRVSPSQLVAETGLSPTQKKHVARLMRVNHSGEVCAQALYQGQALTAQLTHVKKQMIMAANEEIDHLGWCEGRLHELNSHTSWLNPIWYMGSLMIGAFAGLAGDRISLGFVAETELQVSAHLQNHILKLPKEDIKTKVILEQMYEDESHHATIAQGAGAVELPDFIKKIMQGVSKLMTKTSYYI